MLRLAVIGAAVAATVVTPSDSRAAEAGKAPVGLEVTVSGVTGSVRQYETAVARITARNPSDTTMTVTGVELLAPDGIEDKAANPIDPTKPIVLEPGDAEVFSWTISVPDQVTAGKHPLVFTVDYTRDGAALTATAASTIETAAIGQTGGLDVLKVSFLFLPGFLALAVFYLLTTVIGTQPEWAKRLAPNNPEAWAIGVLLSFAAIPVYSAVSGRSYLGGYAMRDLAIVWVGSVVAGLVLWLLYRAGRRITRARLAAYQADRTPAPGDSPAVLLDKLTRKRWLRGGVPKQESLHFPQVRIRHGGDVLQVFKLADVEAAPPMCWIAPPLELDRTALGPRWELVASAVASDRAADLARALKPSTGAAGWAPTGTLAGPELVPADDLVTDLSLRPRLFVQEQGP